MTEDLKDVFLEIEKSIGKGNVMIGNEFDITIPILASSGSLGLDLALGCGGIPKGRIMQIAGPSSSGKTTLSLHCMREAQLKYPDKFVAFLDVEFSFDRDWAIKMGVNVDKLVISQPDCAEDALTIAETLIKSNKFSLIIIDSVGGLVTKAMINGEFGDSFMAQVARLLSTSLPKLNRSINETGTTLIVLNQLRSNIGGYGNPEVRMGGKALEFASSIILDTRRRDIIGDKDNPIGFITQIKVAKNKCGSPYKSALVELYLGPDKYGVDTFSEIVDIAAENGIIHKGGAWYKYTINEVEERWQGKINVVNYLRENLAIYEEIKNLVYKTVLKKEVPEENSFVKVVSSTVEEKKERKKRKKDDEVNLEEMNIVETSRGSVNVETGEILEHNVLTDRIGK